MKRIISLIAVIALSAAVISCDKKDLSELQPVQLEVNAHTISGQWQLLKWNGEELAEGTYVYLDIVRNDKTYTMYQNMDSFTDVPHVLTGSYFLYTDEELGAIIRGNYDHDGGEWAHRYSITNLTENEMYWVSTDNPSFTQQFIRVDNIPVAE